MNSTFVLYSRSDPHEEAVNNSAVENALRAPRLIDNEVIAEETIPAVLENLPAAVLFSLPGAEYSTSFSLSRHEDEGSGNYRSFHRFIKTLTDLMSGAAYCHETGELIVGKQAQQFEYPIANEYTPMLTVACYFLPRKPFSEYAAKFVDGLESLLPPALPVCYGKSDSPEFLYSSDKKQLLTEFLKSENAPVWYSSSPITHVLISDATREVAQGGFRVSRVAISVLAAVWEYPEWQFALRRITEFMMELFDGFFAQIVPSEKMGVAAWWWMGIPLETGCFVSFGKEYLDLIPDCNSEKNISHLPGIASFSDDAPPHIPSELISFPNPGAKKGIVLRNNFKRADVIPFGGQSNAG